MVNAQLMYVDLMNWNGIGNVGNKKSVSESEVFVMNSKYKRRRTSEHVHEGQRLWTNDIFMYLLPDNNNYVHRAFPPAYYHGRIPIT